MMFEGVKWLLMSHWVFGKNAVGVPHASVLTDPEPLSTSDGTLPAWRDQNQTLMKFGVRSIAYLQNGNTISHSSYGEGREGGSSRTIHRRCY
jgi:hypothetical protein